MTTRRRRLTPKAMELYLERVKKFQLRLNARSCHLEELLVDLQPGSESLRELSVKKKCIIEAFDAYNHDIEDFKHYLVSTRTEESETELESVTAQHSHWKKQVNEYITVLSDLMIELAEKVSDRVKVEPSKKGSVKGSVSGVSARTSILAKKAEAESAKLKVLFAEKQALLKKEKAALIEQDTIEQAARAKKKAMIDTEIDLLACRENAAVAEAEVHVMENFSDFEDCQSRVSQSEVLVNLPKTNPMVKVASYIHDTNIANVQHHLPDRLDRAPEVSHREPASTSHQIIHQQTEMQSSDLPLDVARFLLKKDLMLSRLTAFSDKPECYRAWKATFQSIVNDLQTNASEEIDMLVKYLGPDSRKHAVSLKSVYVSNPELGLSKIWTRLDDQYGAVELVKNAVMTKLNKMHSISMKDPKKLYDLVDVLLEVQALKEDPMYSTQLSYFDSSEGILPVVHKLPLYLQERWVTRAAGYKKGNNDTYPPFTFFVNFINDLAKMKNDPGLVCIGTTTDRASSHVKPVACKKTQVEKDVSESDLNRQFRCPIHRANHSLSVCRVFQEKPILERKSILRENRICFKCLQSDLHRSSDCKKQVKCSYCGSLKHMSLMHEMRDNEMSRESQHGGERGALYSERKVLPNSDSQGGNGTVHVKNKCTQICGTNGVGNRSCAKVVLVDVVDQENPTQRVRTYALIDEQSNRSLASPELFDRLGSDCELTEYTLDSCSGPTKVQGRKVSNWAVESVDGSCKYGLPPLLECSQIPNVRDEIPSQEITSHFSHLQRIASKVPPLDTEADILLLVGRDLLAAHHVHEQIIGADYEPFAQRLGLGWVIIGQVCLGQIHLNESVNCKKTYLLPNGRQSLFPPCSSNLNAREHVKTETDNLFVRTDQDDEVGLSVEDKEFLSIMDEKMVKSPQGHWSAPLPFRKGRQSLPNNKAYALKRASILNASLDKNPKKLDHFVQFMDQVIGRGHAEIAPPISDSQECWYLPLFGVYHPKKPDQVRGVFDASAKFQNVALNDVLLQGPDLINSLIGILLRFRKDKVAISADIERMFYSFLVDEKDRDFLRFFWYEGNDPARKMIEYRMTVHVFGNRPSPSVANFGLQKTAALSEQEFGSDVKEFVSQNFYVDDGLMSKPTVDQAVDLMKRTQAALQKNGSLRLHKFASNEQEVLEAFPSQDLAKDLSILDLSKDYLPMQRSLGLLWNLSSDCFSFSGPDFEKPFTRRGVLSVVNSLYDPLGFVAPVSIVGKTLLKGMTVDSCGWDDPLPEKYMSEWQDWTHSLRRLSDVSVPRKYVCHSVSQASHNTLLVFSDASEKAVASVVYLVSQVPDSAVEIGFVMGKAKVAPSKGHTIPRLELCAAVLSVEITDFVLAQIDIEIQEVRYFTDSKVVLGYISNTKRRFYTYVANRVERILRSSNPSQWRYINTGDNPADVGTRGVSPAQMTECSWLKGPPERVFVESQLPDECYSLQTPSQDKEVRPDVKCLATKSVEDNCLNDRYFEKFSSYTRLIQAVANLQHVCQSFNKSCECQGWHLCPEASDRQNLAKAESFILQSCQAQCFAKEIQSLKQGGPVSSQSTILSLNPVLDRNGVLRVGGRLKHSNLPTKEKNPVIVSGKSHLGLLLIRHFHEQVLHQGRHFTEGAVRAGGFWITNGKSRISSYIFTCVQCRKLRGSRQQQIMADLPADRLQPAAPFTYVGVDVFGPWSVVVRKTRGGQSSAKRWAVLFTCLTIRAVHVELLEEMTSSAFINALRRFIAIRGNVVELRSDNGTNFVGSTSDLGIEAINVEDRPIKRLLKDKGVAWIFNPPHASHMGGVWERMIGVIRRLLDSLLTSSRLHNLTHDVLATFMAEVCAIVNSRPIVPVSADSNAPEILSPSMLLTQKSSPPTSFAGDLSLKDIYRVEWKRVQVLADEFWTRWRSEFLPTLQSRQKWMTPKPNLKVGDVVLLKDETTSRNQWPVAVIVEAYLSSDSKVRSVKVKFVREGKSSFLVRPVTELVLLLGE